MTDTQTQTVTILNPPETNPAIVYISGLAPGSRPTMSAALDVAARELGYPDRYTCDWTSITYGHVEALKATLSERLSPASVNKLLCAVRGVLRAAWRLGLISSEQYQNAAAVKGVSGSTVPAGREVTPLEISCLLSACDDSPLGLRDAAIIAILFLTGLRRHELVNLTMADYITEDSLLIHGKRNRERIAYLNNDAQTALSAWLLVRGTGAGAIFTRTTGLNPLTKLSSQTIYNVLRVRAKQSLVRPFSPHDMRRTFCGSLLSAGCDISTVSRAMGHRDIHTTQLYDHRPADLQKAAVQLIRLPARKVK